MRFLARRAVFYLIALFVAITINFLIPRMMTGDPVQMMFARFQGRLDPSAVESLYRTFGFVEGPLSAQYVAYLGSLLQGNLGTSIAWFPAPVTQVLSVGLAWTLRLLGVSTLIAFSLGMFLGVRAAWKRGHFADNFLVPITGLFGAFPYFWLAMIMLYVFALRLGWFPLGHAASLDLNQDWGDPQYVLSVIYHMILPATTIVLTAVGGWLLGMRNNMINVLSEDHVAMAQAKGLSDRRVKYVYAARNAMLPSITGFAMSLGFIVGGAIVTEVVFSYPGVGYTLLTAINARDYPLMQGCFLLITIAVLSANLLADAAYVLLDPRVRG
jgi:peptide/nickel transport system permease protein